MTQQKIPGMNIDENTRLEKIEKTVDDIKKALLGNEFSGEKGFRGKIDDLKSELEIVKTDIKTLRDERVEYKMYILIIKFLLASLAVSGIAYFFKI